MSLALVKPRSVEAAVSLIEKAQGMLEAAHTFHEVRDVRDLAKAAGVFLKSQVRAKNAAKASVVHAKAIVFRAERRLDAYYRAIPKAKGTRGQLAGRRTSGGPKTRPLEDAAPTLKELGIDKHDAHTWRTAGRASEEAFDSYIGKCIEKEEVPTESGLRRLTAEPEPPKPPEPFHALIARGDLKSALEKTLARQVSEWPEVARAMVPEVLRDMADNFERGLLC